MVSEKMDAWAAGVAVLEASGRTLPWAGSRWRLAAHPLAACWSVATRRSPVPACLAPVSFPTRNQMLSGRNPFCPATDIEALARQQMYQAYRAHATEVAATTPWVHEVSWGALPEEADGIKGFISAELNPDPRARPSPAQLLASAFVQRAAEEGPGRRRFIYRGLCANGTLDVIPRQPAVAPPVAIAAGAPAAPAEKGRAVQL
jgi:hypothetical protein